MLLKPEYNYMHGSISEMINKYSCLGEDDKDNGEDGDILEDIDENLDKD